MNSPCRIPIDRAFFIRPADEVASDLIGATLLVDNVGGKIIETEAYDQYNDEAAHCHNPKSPQEPWKTALNKSMFLEGGHAYVCHGRQLLHLNFVCEKSDVASAVLIRAIEPFAENIAAITERRAPNFKGSPSIYALCAGPGSLCEALSIGCELDGKSLFEPPFQLFARQGDLPVCRSTRIGVTKNKLERRFFLEGNKYLSKGKTLRSH